MTMYIGVKYSLRTWTDVVTFGYINPLCSTFPSMFAAALMRQPMH